MQKRMSWAVCCAAAQRQIRRTVCWAAAFRRMRRTGCSAAVLRRVHRAACCAAVLALVLLLCGNGDMVLPQQQRLPELGAVERQMRALTADAPDGWRYSLRVLPGSGGTALTAEAARRDASGTWETIHTLWLPENGTWRMVRQTRLKHAPMSGAEGDHG